jgi:hypothetical protein
MRSWMMALVLSLFVAAEAFAGGLHARIEGPAADGVTYTARVLSCTDQDALEPWGYAEGVVDGRPKELLIRFEPTGEHGVYRFTRNWPNEGKWMIRVNLGHPPAPATVATLRADGTVKNNHLYFQSDGTKECWAVLKKYRIHRPGEEDC